MTKTSGLPGGLDKALYAFLSHMCLQMNLAMFLFVLVVMTGLLCAYMRLAILACADLMSKMALLVVGGSLVHLSISCSSIS